MCKDNHNLIKGEPKKVFQRMIQDVQDEFNAQQWRDLVDGIPKKRDYPIVVKDATGNLRTLQVSPGKDFFDFFTQWCRLPREKKNLGGKHGETQKKS